MEGLKISGNRWKCSVGSILNIYFILQHQHDELDNFNHFFRQTIMPLTTWMTACAVNTQHYRKCYFTVSSVQYFRASVKPWEVIEHNLFFDAITKEFCNETNWLNDNQFAIMSAYSSWWLGGCTLMAKNYHTKGAGERYLIGSSDHDKQATFDVINSSVANLVNSRYDLHFQNEKRNHTARKTIVIYTREDAKLGRKLLNGNHVATVLRHQFPHMQVLLVDKLVSNATNSNEFYSLFSTASVFIAPHGGWMPNVLFMQKNALVLTIQREDQELFHFKVWDLFFESPAITVLLLNEEGQKMQSQLDRDIEKYFVPTVLIRDKIGNVELLNLTNIVSAIRNHFAHN
jgi:hypothetical protein